MRILLLLSIVLPCLQQLQLYVSVDCFEFQVGDTRGWEVPPPNDTDIYNHWASRNRFKIGDAIRFKYKKDSVMEVTKKDYAECNATRPSLFSNTGDTVFALNRSGSFYFISGTSGHCQRGQRMILKVLAEYQVSGSSSSALMTLRRRPSAWYFAFPTTTLLLLLQYGTLTFPIVLCLVIL